MRHLAFLRMRREALDSASRLPASQHQRVAAALAADAGHVQPLQEVHVDLPDLRGRRRPPVAAERKKKEKKEELSPRETT